MEFRLTLPTLLLTLACLGSTNVHAQPMQETTPGKASPGPKDSLGEGRGVSYFSAYGVDDLLMEPAADVAFRLDNTPIGLAPPASFVWNVSRKRTVVLRRGQITRPMRLRNEPRGFRVTLTSFGVDPTDAPLFPGLAPVASFESQNDALFPLLDPLLAGPSDPSDFPETEEGMWSAEIREAIAQGHVIVGMDAQQVLRAWGSPVQVTTLRASSGETWLFMRGATLADQIRNGTNVSFWDGRVIDVESGPAWRTQPAGRTTEVARKP
jgi:hypothetical protein